MRFEKVYRNFRPPYRRTPWTQEVEIELLICAFYAKDLTHTSTVVAYLE